MTEASIQKLIEAVEAADSAERLTDAMQDLAEARCKEAIPILIEALGYNNPGAAVAAVDGLVALGKPAVEPVLQQLDGYNYGARAWGLRVLAGIGDPRGLELLLETAEKDFALSVRRAAARGLGNILWQDMAPEKVPEAREKILKTLLLVCEDPEWVVRYAAIAGLEGLGKAIVTSKSADLPPTMARLEEIAKTDAVLAVRARAELARQELIAKVRKYD